MYTHTHTHTHTRARAERERERERTISIKKTRALYLDKFLYHTITRTDTDYT